MLIGIQGLHPESGTPVSLFLFSSSSGKIYGQSQRGPSTGLKARRDEGIYSSEFVATPLARNVNIHTC
jgi:hypothetical protein